MNRTNALHGMHGLAQLLVEDMSPLQSRLRHHSRSQHLAFRPEAMVFLQRGYDSSLDNTDLGHLGSYSITG